MKDVIRNSILTANAPMADIDLTNARMPPSSPHMQVECRRSQTKGQPRGCPSNSESAGFLGCGALGAFRLLRRPGVLAAGVLVAVDELDHRHRGVVAEAEAGLEHAGVAAAPRLVARAEHLEELPHHV